MVKNVEEIIDELAQAADRTIEVNRAARAASIKAQAEPLDVNRQTQTQPTAPPPQQGPPTQ